MNYLLAILITMMAPSVYAYYVQATDTILTAEDSGGCRSDQPQALKDLQSLGKAAMVKAVHLRDYGAKGKYGWVDGTTQPKCTEAYSVWKIDDSVSKASVINGSTVELTGDARQSKIDEWYPIGKTVTRGSKEVVTVEKSVNWGKWDVKDITEYNKESGRK